jgi:hypothetical protein
MSYERAGRYDLIIDKGSTWERTLILKYDDDTRVDLSGFYAELDIRVTEFSEEVEIQLDSNSPTILLGGTSGTITLILSPSITEAFTTPVGKYDLKLIAPDNTTEFILYGTVKINQTVTR